MSFNFATATMATAKAYIADKMATDNNWLDRGLIAIYNRQTADERSSETTTHENGIGFTGGDAAFGSRMAQQLLDFQQGRSPYTYPFSIRQREAVRKMMKKYAGQLARMAIAKAKAQAAIEEADAKAEYDAEHATPSPTYAQVRQYEEERFADMGR